MSAVLHKAARAPWAGAATATLTAALISVVAGAALADLQPSTEAALIAGIGVACIGPLAIRVAQRRFDIFEPIVVGSVALFVMYALRPAAIVSSGEWPFFKGYNVGDTVVEALVVSFAGVVALQVGYMLPSGRNLAQRFSGGEGRWDAQLAVAWGGLLAVTAIGLYVVFLSQSGGLHVLGEFIEGRSPQQDSYFRQSTAYLYAAPQLLWPASLLIFAVGVARRHKGLLALGILPLLPLAVFASGQGSRIVLLPLLLSPAVYVYLSRNSRPRPLAVAIVGYLILTVGIAYFRETREASENVSRIAELEHAILDPRYEIDQLVGHGTDNDMFESLAVELQVVPEVIRPSPLDFVYRTLAKPIPSVIWTGKPLAPEEHLTKTLYPNEQIRASSSSGFVGSLYLAGALPAVVLGMLAAGVLFRVPWEYARRFPGPGPPQIFLVVALMFIPILLRGGIGDTMARALFAFAPILIASRLCWRRQEAAR